METNIEITREEGDSKGRYVAVVYGQKAEKTYSRMGETTIIIDHTGVPDALRGRGVGEALVRRGVEDARAERSSTFGQTAIAVLLFENLAIVPFLLLVTLLAPSG